MDGTEIEINLGSCQTSVRARGSQAALTELCEELSWLGAALRTSPMSSGLCAVTPQLELSSNCMGHITAQMRFDVIPILNEFNTIEGTCWHSMFRNPMVVGGFPILARHENERGLEISLGMMNMLAEVHFATQYDSTLILKGLCTMLVPTRKTEHSITWHFLFNKQGKRIPYYTFRKSCGKCVGTEELDIRHLEDAGLRNFVGWASDITRHLGTVFKLEHHSLCTS